MKRTFFALALLVSAAASATVKLAVEARCNEDVLQQEFTLNVQEVVMLEHDKTGKIVILLENEDTEKATLKVSVLDENGSIRDESEVNALYGAEVKLGCKCEKVDAELTLVATSLNTVEN